MQLGDLTFGVVSHKYNNNSAIEITGISCQSKQVQEGDLFVCLPGYQAVGGEVRTNTHEFAADAVKAGAVAILCQQKVEVPASVPVYIVEDSWAAFSHCSSSFYGHPSRDLNVIGVTGTNGKTSVAYMVESIFNHASRNIGVISTINHRFPSKIVSTANTTPEANVIHRFMREVLDAGVKNIVMEVTSHALILGRVRDVDFKTAVFTNLSQDHLDFHGTLSNYFEAKKLLFKSVADNKGTVVVNVDDDHGCKLMECYSYGSSVTFGINNHLADLRALDVRYSTHGTSFKCFYKNQTEECSIKLIGEHFVANALAAIGVGLAHGIALDLCVAGLADVTIPGRSQIVPSNLPFKVVVDFAHSPEGMQKALIAAHIANPRRIITVFGCGGNRDKTKRALMANVASEHSDYVIVTSDNPRYEDPVAIIDDIRKGITIRQAEYILDRREALERAISIAGEGDLVLVLGRGHEEFQLINGEKIPFSDTETVAEILNS